MISWPACSLCLQAKCIIVIIAVIFLKTASSAWQHATPYLKVNLKKTDQPWLVQDCEPRFFTSARPDHLCDTAARLERKQTASVSSWQPSANPRSSPQRIFTYFLLGWVKTEFYFSTRDFISVILYHSLSCGFLFFFFFCSQFKWMNTSNILVLNLSV